MGISYFVGECQGRNNSLKVSQLHISTRAVQTLQPLGWHPTDIQMIQYIVSDKVTICVSSTYLKAVMFCEVIALRSFVPAYWKQEGFILT